MMRYVRVVLLLICCLSCIPAIAFIASLPFVWWGENSQWGLGDVGGIIADADAIFVASSNQGRVYKFGYDGALLGHWINHGGPIRIHHEYDVIVVEYSGREIPIGDEAFRLHGKPRGKVRVQRSWWGNPTLAISDGRTTREVSIQPWYLTLIQGPYPGGCWPLLVILPGAFLAWDSDRRRTASEREAAEGNAG